VGKHGFLSIFYSRGLGSGSMNSLKSDPSWLRGLRLRHKIYFILRRIRPRLAVHARCKFFFVEARYGRPQREEKSRIRLPIQFSQDVCRQLQRDVVFVLLFFKVNSPTGWGAAPHPDPFRIWPKLGITSSIVWKTRVSPWAPRHDKDYT